MDSFKSSVFGQPLVNLCFKMFYRQTSSSSANVRNSQKSFPHSQIPTAQQNIFNLIKPLSQIPAKTKGSAKISLLQMKIKKKTPQILSCEVCLYHEKFLLKRIRTGLTEQCVNYFPTLLLYSHLALRHLVNTRLPVSLTIEMAHTDVAVQKASKENIVKKVNSLAWFCD